MRRTGCLKRTPLALLVALTLVLAACGDGDGGEEEVEPDPAEEPEEAPGDPAEGEPAEQEEPAEEPEAAEPMETTQMTIGLGSDTIGPAQSPYTSLPDILGFWEEEGLEVEVLGFPGGSAALQNMDAGHIDGTFTGTPSYFVALESGQDDWIAVYAQVSKNIFQPAVAEDSPIQEVADLEGKTIGVPGLEFSVIPIVTSALANEGLDPDSIEWIVTGAGADAMAALQAGRVDAIGMYDSIYAEIENLGQPLRLVTNDEIDNIGFHNTFVAPKPYVEENRDALIGLLRGVAKATEFAQANPEAAVQLHYERHPESKPTGVSDEVALEHGLRHLGRRTENTQPVEGLWGFSTDEQVQAHVDLMIDTGQMSEGWSVEDVFDSSMIEEINDFDNDEIIRMAEEWEM